MSRLFLLPALRSFRYSQESKALFCLLVFIYLSFYGVWTSVMLGAVVFQACCESLEVLPAPV